MQNNPRHERPATELYPNPSLGWIKILIFLLPVLTFLPGILGKIPYFSESAVYTDLLITHYPNALYLRQAIQDFHQIPLWSTLIHSGAPFAANPLSGLFYLPGWVAILFPLPAGISISLAAHAVLGTWGMYCFLRKDGAREVSAIGGALVFGLMPKIAAHYGAGHVSMIYAISWTPWLFWVGERDKKGWITGGAAAMIFLADPRWAVYAGLVWFLYRIAHRHKGMLILAVPYYLKASAAALMIASPLVIPLVEYVRLSTRSKMDITDILAYSLPPDRILGLFLPVSPNPEWYLYAGGAVLVLFIIQLFNLNLLKGNWFWNIGFGLSLMVAIGSWLIDPAWLANIPVISWLRVPARILFISGLCLSVITGRTLDHLAQKKIDPDQMRKISFAIIIFGLVMAGFITAMLGEFAIEAMWGFSFLILTSIYINRASAINRSGLWQGLLISLLVVDLAGAGLLSLDFRDRSDAIPRPVVEALAAGEKFARTYSPSYSIPQDRSVEYGIELADGVDPMQISKYADFMAGASGVGDKGYSVTIPAFISGNPSVDNIEAVPDPALLSLLNVRYIYSGFELQHQNLERIAQLGSAFLYKNNVSGQRAWIEEIMPGGDRNPAEEKKSAEIVSFSPNRISIRAAGPGRLVLSEIFYPGWRATVDGTGENITPAYGILRSVDLASGDHDIVFSFLPVSVYTGIALAIVGWALIGYQIGRRQR